MTTFSKHKNIHSGVEEVEQAWQNTGLTEKDNLIEMLQFFQRFEILTDLRYKKGIVKNEGWTSCQGRIHKHCTGEV